MRIGVIADTHGNLLHEVQKAFAGVSLILHAGDIGGEGIITELSTIARVVSVRGNTDTDLVSSYYPETRRFTIEGIDIFLCHEPERAQGLKPPPALIIHGHTHYTRNEQIGATRWFNPGTAGKPKLGGVYTVGVLTVDKGALTTEIVRLR